MARSSRAPGWRTSSMQATIPSVAFATPLTKPIMMMRGSVSRLMLPSLHPIASETSTALIAALTATATKAATQLHGSNTSTGPAIWWKTSRATDVESANWPTLNGSRMGAWWRTTARETATPTAWAITIHTGSTTVNRPMTSATSDIENECALRTKCRWTTSSSAMPHRAANASSGISRSTVRWGIAWTGPARSSAAARKIRAFSAQIRHTPWYRSSGGQRRAGPGSVVGEVVTSGCGPEGADPSSYRPSRAPPRACTVPSPQPRAAPPPSRGRAARRRAVPLPPASGRPRGAGPGRAGPCGPAPSAAGPGRAGPCGAAPGRAAPGAAGPGRAGPGRAAPGRAAPGAAVPAPAAPGGAVGGCRGHLGAVPGVAEDVDLARDRRAVELGAARAARGVERAGAGGRRAPPAEGGLTEGRVHRLVEADQAVPLGAGGLAEEAHRLRVKEVLQLVRGDPRPLLDQQGGAAGDQRAGLGRAAALEEPGAQAAGRAVGRGDLGAGHLEARDRDAGRDHVGGAPAVRGGRARERGDVVVPPDDGALRVGGADREQVRVDGRAREAVVGVVLARVPGRSDDEDALAPGLLEGEGERVDAVALGRVRAERQLDHADVEAVRGTVLHDPVDRGDDLGDVGDAVAVADLHVDDPGVRRDAEEAARVGEVGEGRAGLIAPGDDAGEVRAVPVVVPHPAARVLGVEGEVRPVDDLAGLVQALDPGDAGVDQRDVHAVAGDAPPPPPLAP